ncbi:MAG: putative oxygen-independent coproporphyrinogen III oxidase [Lentisphaeria bacterium]
MFSVVISFSLLYIAERRPHHLTPWKYSLVLNLPMRTSLDFLTLPPLSIYVHIPWCVRKCPYCDFNSHQQNGNLPVTAYCKALFEDLHEQVRFVQGRKVESIFIGGGTPSLFPTKAIAAILDRIDSEIGLSAEVEITMEANPGTAEYQNFSELSRAGINRLSLGVQSFNDDHLQSLGRIHNGNEAKQAFDLAHSGGIENINIDLMHGLPKQSAEQALADLDCAMALGASHLSWYQLTIEKNTEFYSNPPQLPNEDTLADIQDAGSQLLSQTGFQQYEISAYSREGKQSKHNLNYWQFGDYLAIGAGAHGKITQIDNSDAKLQQSQQAALNIVRYNKTRAPSDYMNLAKPYTTASSSIAKEKLPLEFMMNAMRLNAGVAESLFSARTGLALESIAAKITYLQGKGLMDNAPGQIRPSAQGQRFLNNLLEHFMSLA